MSNTVKKISKVFLIYPLPLLCSAIRGVKSFSPPSIERERGREYSGIFDRRWPGSWSDGGPGNESVTGFHGRQSLVEVCFRHQSPRQEVRLEVENDLVQ